MTFDELPEEQKEYFRKAEKQGIQLGKILSYLIGLAIAIPLFIFKHPIIACFVIVAAILAPHSEEAKKSILGDMEFYPQDKPNDLPFSEGDTTILQEAFENIKLN